MRTFIIILLSFFAFSPVTLKADELSDLFNKVKDDKGVAVDSVFYTGSDMMKAGGFYMQRGSGSGWTKGERLTVNNVDPKVLEQVKSICDYYIKKGDGFSKNNWACLYFEPEKRFFGYEYSAESNTLWLLSAFTEGEICVPSTWTKNTYIDASEYDPFKGADADQLKMLGLSRLWEGVNRWFVYRDKIPVNWDSLYMAAMPEMLAAKTPQEWTAVLERMAAHAHDGHTMVYSYSDGRRNAPFSTVMIDSMVYVRDVYDPALGLFPGDRITAIDDCPVVEYAEEKVIPYIASSTPQWTMHEAFDGNGLLRRLPADTVRLSLGNGKKIEYVAGNYKNEGHGESVFRLSKVAPGISLLRISTFMGDNFKQEFSEIYDSILASKALIIDLRDNDGGNSGNGDYILRHICRDSIPTGRWESPISIPAFTSWGMTPEPYRGGGEKMAPFTEVPIYTNPIVVLIDRGTFSATEDFVSLFRGARRGTVIGTPSAGSTGNGVRIDLIPHHSMANICSKHDTAPDGTEFVGIGHIPDIIVEETWQSTFGDSIDAATAKAIEYLTQLLQNP